jgi:hypothetical protein
MPPQPVARGKNKIVDFRKLHQLELFTQFTYFKAHGKPRSTENIDPGTNNTNIPITPPEAISGYIALPAFICRF